MTYKVSIDAGHGLRTGGKRTPKLKKDLVVDGKVVKKKGQIIHEFEFNIKVAKALKKALERCGIQAKIVNDTTGVFDTPLSTRASRANAYGSDLHVSCHYNAIGSCTSFQNKCSGVLVLKTRGCSSKSARLANCVHNAIKGNYSHTYGVGVDTNWSGFTLAILRQTNMPAILIEYGFMDYEAEAMKMLQPDWYNKLAEDTCKGICKYLGVAYKKASNKTEEKPKETKVNKEGKVNVPNSTLNVRKLADADSSKLGELKDNAKVKIVATVSNGWLKIKYKDGYGYISGKYVDGIKDIVVKEDVYYRVVIGSYAIRDNAVAEQQKVIKAGYKDAFLVADEIDDKTTIYQVVADSLTDRKDADKIIEALEKKGFDAFISIYKK